MHSTRKLDPSKLRCQWRRSTLRERRCGTPLKSKRRQWSRRLDTSQRGKILLLALPEDIKVSIRDTGNGMTPDQVQMPSCQ